MQETPADDNTRGLRILFDVQTLHVVDLPLLFRIVIADLPVVAVARMVVKRKAKNFQNL